MVSALLIDALKNPTKALQDLYSTRAADIDTFPGTVASHFSEIFLKTKNTFRELPPLDVAHPPESYSDRSLVRFRAMIQDTSPSPEMYLPILKGNKCGGWGISHDMNEDQWPSGFDYSNLRECTTVWAVSVPGEAAWRVEESEYPPSANLHHSSQPHKFPIPDAPHVGVQIKIYDTDSARSLKTTDVVTFVGILASEPLVSESEAPLDVSTLHVLFHQVDTIEVLEHDSLNHAGELRDELIDWIASEALGGDRDAAEWVLLSVIAKVHLRAAPLLPPSLTLSRFPQPKVGSTTPALSHVLSEILPMFLTIPLSLDILNNVKFTPESIEENLHSGILQVAQGTVVLLTESGIQEGQLVEKGIMNIRALQEVMNSQTLEYAFPYSKFSFPTDIVFVVCSEGRKSAFFQTTIVIPWQGDASADLYKSKNQVNLPSPERLSAFRSLVSAARVSRESVQVTEATSKHIQEDFVRRRQEDKSITADDFIHLMRVARLLAGSLCEKEITVEVWERAKTLDARRKSR
ncbi:hypothetical protein BV22DRAFT_1084528 [Leucogyrophana mollusca]|uniref:Uncharacterized protein n=1 Tax=Leucogyrophana mollusca TaxID=85980 RepID=A0ACB8BQ12_9AGAM|nr:hypothetical protein BV22DRAFT_1084528 [Leucogyrophana mollusca]